jgi:hypothetical protein
MILKFDHISYSCDATTDVSQHVPAHYKEIFRETDLDNIPCKIKYLQFNSSKHNIFMYESKNDDGADLPIEITQYPQIAVGSTPLRLEGRTIIWEVADVESARKLFLCLGAQEETEKNKLRIVPFLDKTKILIHFVENISCTRKPFLDISGFSSIGLFVDSVQKYLTKLSKAGFTVSGISPIEVHGKQMNIAFVEGRNGELIELISMMKERK